jgi:hypothetical protein
MRRLLRLTLIWASFAATFAVFATTAYAGAFTYYASPSGSGNCKSAATPCKLEKAVEVEALNEDTIVVEPGTYTLQASGLGIGKAIDIGGLPGAPPPIIVTTSTGNVHVGAAAKPHLHDLRIEGNGLILSSGSAERIFISYTGSSTSGCSLAPGATLTDSVCWSHNGGGGSSALNTGGSTTGTITLRNVTAVTSASSATAIYAAASSGGFLTLNGTNVIAIGHNHPDVEAIPSVGGTMTINLSHSDYRTAEESKSPLGTVTPPGSNGNITALPTFLNAAAGDFTQVSGSPTIDVGLNDALNGATDIAGNPRSLGICVGGPGVADIGAYEFVPTAACPVPAPPSPSNEFTLGKLKLNKKTGTATLSVTLPGAGQFTLSGKGVKKVTRSAKGAATLKLPVKPVGKAKKVLRANGKLKVNLKLKFVPTGGTAATKSKKATLKEITP